MPSKPPLMVQPRGVRSGCKATHPGRSRRKKMSRRDIVLLVSSVLCSAQATSVAATSSTASTAQKKVFVKHQTSTTSRSNKGSISVARLLSMSGRKYSRKMTSSLQQDREQPTETATGDDQTIEEGSSTLARAFQRFSEIYHARAPGGSRKLTKESSTSSGKSSDQPGVQSHVFLEESGKEHSISSSSSKSSPTPSRRNPSDNKQVDENQNTRSINPMSSDHDPASASVGVAFIRNLFVQQLINVKRTILREDEMQDKQKTTGTNTTAHEQEQGHGGDSHSLVSRNNGAVDKKSNVSSTSSDNKVSVKGSAKDGAIAFALHGGSSESGSVEVEQEKKRLVEKRGRSGSMQGGSSSSSSKRGTGSKDGAGGSKHSGSSSSSNEDEAVLQQKRSKEEAQLEAEGEAQMQSLYKLRGPRRLRLSDFKERTNFTLPEDLSQIEYSSDLDIPPAWSASDYEWMSTSYVKNFDSPNQACCFCKEALSIAGIANRTRKVNGAGNMVPPERFCSETIENMEYITDHAEDIKWHDRLNVTLEAELLQDNGITIDTSQAVPKPGAAVCKQRCHEADGCSAWMWNQDTTIPEIGVCKRWYGGKAALLKENRDTSLMLEHGGATMTYTAGRCMPALSAFSCGFGPCAKFVNWQNGGPESKEEWCWTPGKFFKPTALPAANKTVGTEWAPCGSETESNCTTSFCVNYAQNNLTIDDPDDKTCRMHAGSPWTLYNTVDNLLSRIPDRSIINEGWWRDYYFSNGRKDTKPKGYIPPDADALIKYGRAAIETANSYPYRPKWGEKMEDNTILWSHKGDRRVPPGHQGS
ncbi:unnamed protein product [Amoebophrya sp. A25]|nr:unnamed protein product [Amoebophrya sp. A25]|eukprot:GSA25T00007300001.1